MADQQEIHVDTHIQIHRMPSDLYLYWRNPENMPHILDFLEEVMALDDQQSRWTVLVAGNERITWDTEITEEIRGQLIRWHSGGNMDVLHDGLVRFSGTGKHRVTDLHLQLNFFFPLMKDSRPDMLGEDMENRVREDLQRFKQAVEANEFPKKRREGKRGLPWGFPGAAPQKGSPFSY
ncbi:MAG: SRPBCC family protein [Chitinispirillaceae bacterium]